MPVHDARYISGPGDPGGVKGMGAEPDGEDQTDDSNDNGPAHDAVHFIQVFPKANHRGHRGESEDTENAGRINLKSGIDFAFTFDLFQFSNRLSLPWPVAFEFDFCLLGLPNTNY